MKMLQEHLFIVCELLRSNLYEFQKFNEESGGEAYFTLRRLQVCMIGICTFFLPFDSFRGLLCLYPGVTG